MAIKDYSSILITGGTGSFGKCFINRILHSFPNFKRIVVFSRDELKQWNMRQIYSAEKYPQLRFFLGDIRDQSRLRRALEGVDLVIHAAALKQVPAAEYNPNEFVKTNVLGANNLVEAALDNNVKKVVALSTDKAAGPINLYGATKLCADKIFLAANNYKGSRDLSFSVVRYGNVLGSRGSVIPLFLKMAKKGFLDITHESMTRFSISLEEGVNLVIFAIEKSIGGEMFIPKIPSYRITDVANAIGPSIKKNIIGLRPGEKIHEDMILSSDSIYTYEADNYFLILNKDVEESSGIFDNHDLVKVSDNFSYTSNLNHHFLTVEEIRSLILKEIDPNFKPI